MNILGQEFLDDSINYLSPSDAKSRPPPTTHRRKLCQQRNFCQITFPDEREVVRWCADIPQGPDGIPSYVQDVEFRSSYCWLDSTALGGALNYFHRIWTLATKRSVEPASGIYDSIAPREFGSEVASFALSTPLFSAKTLVQLIPKAGGAVDHREGWPFSFNPTILRALAGGPLKLLQLMWIVSRGSVWNHVP